MRSGFAFRGLATWLALLSTVACGAAPRAALPTNPVLKGTASVAAYDYDCRATAAVDAGSQTPGPVQYQTMIVDARLRDYRLFTPPGLDTARPFPLVIVLHGAPDEAADFEDLIHFQREAANEGFMAVYPDGCDQDWNQAGGSYDVHFLAKLIDELESRYLVDRTRVYVVGASAGAFMAYRLACDMADRLAAIASVSGSMWWNDCAPSRPIPVLEMHGTADVNVPYDGGRSTYKYVGMPAISTVIQRWITFDGCNATPETTRMGITSVSSWTHCRNGAAVQLDTVIGGHHTWFGSTFDPIPGEPDASTAVWEFMKGFTLTT